MFSKEITNSSEFQMMSPSAQALYFHIGMNADDDGFCEVFTIVRMTESKPDDLRSLHERGLVYLIDSKVGIVKDWHTNNDIRSDRYTRSKYLDNPKYGEVYTAIMQDKIQHLSRYKALPVGITSGITDGITQVRLGKDSNTRVAIAPQEISITTDTGEPSEKPNPIIPSPYSIQSTRERWADGEMRLVILSWFLDEKKLWPDSRAKLQAIMRRHNKSAIRLANAGWTKREVMEAKSKALFSEQMKDEWTLDTIEKYLTK